MMLFMNAIYFTTYNYDSKYFTKKKIFMSKQINVWSTSLNVIN